MFGKEVKRSIQIRCWYFWNSKSCWQTL